jgi:hypothetical protein
MYTSFEGFSKLEALLLILVVAFLVVGMVALGGWLVSLIFGLSFLKGTFAFLVANLIWKAFGYILKGIGSRG